LKRRTFLLSLAAASMASVSRAATTATVRPAGPMLGAAINKAGRQRMLSQRMAKAFAMQVLGIMPERAASLLEQSRRLFEVQLVELREVVPNDAIQGGLGDLERAWAGYGEVLKRPPTQAGASQVMAESENVLRAAHALTGLYERQAASNAGRLVNLSGRQRMLSQRMAKCFMFDRSGLASGDLRVELETARRDFVAALGVLNGAPENTEEIRLDLALVNTQWLFFEQALNGREPVREIAVRNVATTSERILEVMDGLTGRYEKLVHA